MGEWLLHSTAFAMDSSTHLENSNNSEDLLYKGQWGVK
jgi:hypothetical protein